MKHKVEPNWKVVPIKRLAVVLDWESTMSNHMVAVSECHKFLITHGMLVRVKEEAIWECPMVSLVLSEVIGSVDPGTKKGTSTILR
jgi:hypothetical protein